MYHQLQKSAFAFTRLNILLTVFILLGITLRIFHFIYNRSLWMDEVYLSTSLIKYGYHELIHSPLYYEQKAPIGFLLTVKLMVNTFGKNEFALRIIPLLSGIISLFLFIPVSRYFVDKRIAVVALGILCLSPALIYHSVEIKQYATELLATITAFFLFIKFKDKTSLGRMFVWGLAGGLVLWFSYSAIFILAGIALTISCQSVASKKWSLFFKNAIAFSMWLFIFLANYFLFTYKHAESEWITYWFRSYDNFMPFPPKSAEDVKWFLLTFYRMTDYPLGLLWNFIDTGSSKIFNIILKMPVIPVSLFILGIYFFISKKKQKASLLISAVLLTLLASGLELYPLTERFWVFTSPIFILLIVNGLEYFLTTKIRVTYLLSILVLFAPFLQSALFVVHPEKFYVHKKSAQREALMFVNENYKKNDIVYMYWNNLPGYRLYKLMYPLKFNAIEGQDLRKSSFNYDDYYRNLEPDFQSLKGHDKIWIVFNHRYLTDIGDLIDQPTWYYQNNPIEQLLMKFKKMGKLTKKYSNHDLSVYTVDIVK